MRGSYPQTDLDNNFLEQFLKSFCLLQIDAQQDKPIDAAESEAFWFSQDWNLATPLRVSINKNSTDRPIKFNFLREVVCEK